MKQPIDTRDSAPLSSSRRDLLRHSLYGAGLLAASSIPWGSTAHAASARYSVVTTKAGKIRGSIEDGMHVFKGVPYGADTSTRRYRPALPPVAWKGVRDTLEYGAACPQGDIAERTSEDCLFLNVWTPGLNAGAKRPVMVYIHGGEYSSGSGSSPIYDGTHLCRRGDVVVVTLNHRLNAFGHLYLARLGGADYAASGNVGILDLVQALSWVRDHIAAFGGDPQCVMVFGQSGGGAKIATMMAMPAARGLFHRAATMSGQQITASGPRSATARASAYMGALKIAPADVQKLNAAGVASLVGALRASDATMVGRSLYFGPVLDEVSLPRHPFYPDAPPQSATIPMIIGNTHDETRAFLGNEPGVHSLSWAELPERLLSQVFVDIDPEYVIAEYRRLYPQYSATEVFFAATTAGRSWRGALIETELRAAQGAPVYAYELDYKSPLDGGRYGAMHTMDIPLVFDNVAQPGSRTGTGPDAQRTADQMSDAFIAFARTGNPNHTGLPQWRPYELDSRSTMAFKAQSQLVEDPRGAERRLFAKVPYVQRGTY
ncbi:MAG TPA: carboxylesterase/lipase family protein [Steroidobacteraceae bacterium]|jgi:para-nitrobenzyl esterase